MREIKCSRACNVDGVWIVRGGCLYNDVLICDYTLLVRTIGARLRLEFETNVSTYYILMRIILWWRCKCSMIGWNIKNTRIDLYLFYVHIVATWKKNLQHWQCHSRQSMPSCSKLIYECHMNESTIKFSCSLLFSNVCNTP